MTEWLVRSFDQLTPPELYRIMRLRQQVFVLEQRCLYQDLDDLDQHCLHLCGIEGPTLVAYLRALPPGLIHAESALGRIAVASAARGRGLGRELVQCGLELNLSRWPGIPVRINAQAHLEKLHTSLGFRRVSEPHDEDGIPHIEMLFSGPAPARWSPEPRDV